MTKGAGSLVGIFSKGIYIVAESCVCVDAALAECACFNRLFDKQETCKAGDKACLLDVPIITCIHFFF